MTELKESRAKAEKSLKERERNARREALALKKRQRENQQLLDLVRSRGVQVLTHKVDEDDNLKEAWDLDDLEPTHPAALNKRVHLIQEDSDTLLGTTSFVGIRSPGPLQKLLTIFVIIGFSLACVVPLPRVWRDRLYPGVC